MQTEEKKDNPINSVFSGTSKKGISADGENGVNYLAGTLSSLIDVMDIAMWHLDLDYRVVGSNKKVIDLYGENAIGNFCYHVAAMRDTVCDMCPAKMVYNGQESGRSQHKRINREGKEIYIDHIATPIRNLDGNVIGTLVLIIDITKQKTQEKELLEHRTNLEGMVVARTKELQDSQAKFRALYKQSRRAEKLYLSLLNSSADAIVIYNMDGEVQYLSPSFSDIFGWRLAELKGKKNPFVPESEKESSLKEIRKVFSTCKPLQNFQTKRFTKDGRLLDVYVSASKYDDVEGNPGGLLVILKDVTTTKAMELQLRQTQKMELVGQLAGGVAHDINNMLGVILGHGEMAMTKVDSSQPLFGNLKEIVEAANRSANITRQLLAFARKQTVTPKVIDLNGTVGKLLKMLKRLVGEDIELAWTPGTDLWPVKVDPAQIDQILVNLCVNARDAVTGAGKIIVETGNKTLVEGFCDVHAACPPGEYVEITVSDNGHGIDEETLTHIFEPFFTTKGVGKGTGLGLATVYGAVKQNNGFIYAYSQNGKGTTFTIYLPRHEGEAERTKAEKTVEPASRRHGTILLVEDEPRILKMTAMMLEILGYNVVPAGTPVEAIRLAREANDEIHLLLTDVIMPEMNGRDLAQRLLVSRPGMKCVFMSGYSADVIAHHCILDKGVSFIQKPFSQEELDTKILETLENI